MHFESVKMERVANSTDATKNMSCPPHDAEADPTTGEIACTRCGTVLEQAELSAVPAFAHVAPRITTDQARTAAIARALGSSLPLDGLTATTDARVARQMARSLAEFDADMSRLALPDDAIARTRRVFERYSHACVPRFGSPMRIAGAACAVIVSRMSSSSDPMRIRDVAAHLDLSASLVGAAVVEVGHFVAQDEPESNAMIPAGRRAWQAPYLAADLEDAAYSALRSMHLVGPVVDPPDAVRLAETKAAHLGARPVPFRPLAPEHYDAARSRVPTILRILAPLFEGRANVTACGLVAACLAREAVEGHPCSAAVWSALLGLGPASTVLVRARAAARAIATVAAPLPWARDIKETGRYANLAWFVGQVCDLVDNGVLAVPERLDEHGGPAVAARAAEADGNSSSDDDANQDDDGSSNSNRTRTSRQRHPIEIPAVAKAALQRKEMWARVAAAVRRLDDIGIVRAMPDAVSILGGGGDAAAAAPPPPATPAAVGLLHPSVTLLRTGPIDDADVALESLLIHGVPANELAALWSPRAAIEMDLARTMRFAAPGGVPTAEELDAAMLTHHDELATGAFHVLPFIPSSSSADAASAAAGAAWEMENRAQVLAFAGDWAE
ncbi:hypothetical protein BC828DRAFT_99285 [Blastocladiella britannica]|nr:hypothetical protein BC828DRAFT_99285 [Blastocladiella britannica]